MALALQALVYVLGDPPRTDRFLALTGLTGDALRAGVGDPAIMGAVLEFLANHETDLVAAAAALDVPPETLAAAWETLR
jgi:membrane-bound lytic murein transglycosylase B